MSEKKGSLSINSENIFPIIKKWLYSDHDIFYRELISNGCDAITKLKKLALMGEYEEPEDPDYKITVTVNQKERTIVVGQRYGHDRGGSGRVHQPDRLLRRSGFPEQI